MPRTERRVVITGLGLVTPLGIGVEPFWSSLAEGRGAVRKIQAFPVAGLPNDVGAEVPDFDKKAMKSPGHPPAQEGAPQEPEVHGPRHPALRRRGPARVPRRRAGRRRASTRPGSASTSARA